MEGSATLGHSGVNSEDATRECWQDMPVHPGAENRALLPVSPFHEQDSYF